MAEETSVQPPRTMQELYFCLPEETHVQLIENVLVMTLFFFDAHARLRSEIGVELSIFVKEQKAGGVIFPMHDIYLDSQNIFSQTSVSSQRNTCIAFMKVVHMVFPI